MQSILEKWGSLITEATKLSSIPPAFIAAIIALESGGDPTVTRFEAEDYERLKKEYPDWEDDRVRANATSWGLCQVMGHEYGGPPHELQDGMTNLRTTIALLAADAERFQLDLRKDFEALFRCHNTGHPEGKTYDSLYVQHGIERMKLWQEITSPESAPQ
jgi:Transglycosylase SLT domain